jgi:hypothetical protein
VIQFWPHGFWSRLFTWAYALSPVLLPTAPIFVWHPIFLPYFQRLPRLFAIFPLVRISLPFVYVLLFFFTSQKVSIVQYTSKALCPFHRLSFTPKCRARVPCHKLCSPKLTSSCHGLLLFLKMSCSACNIFLFHFTPPIALFGHSLFVFCLLQLLRILLLFANPFFKSCSSLYNFYVVTLFIQIPMLLKIKIQFISSLDQTVTN